MNNGTIEYQDRTGSLFSLAEQQHMILRPEQIKSAFEGKDIGTDQMLAILRQLHEKGITVASDTNGEESGAEESMKAGTPVPLSESDREYLRQYLSGLEEQQANDPLVTRYMITATKIAAEMNCAEVPLPDLIQEANMALFASAGEAGLKDDPVWAAQVIRKGIQKAVLSAVEEKSRDDSIVARVTRFEQAVRDVNDTDGENFSVAELAILLDMTVDEIRDILRLTGNE